eukprot:5752223-Karenia_brevis.AAC.1
MCEGYAVKHGDRPDHELMAAVRNIDEGVRSEWCRNMRSVLDLTMGEIIADSRNYAASLFMIRPNMGTSTAIVPYIPSQAPKGKS